MGHRVHMILPEDTLARLDAIAAALGDRLDTDRRGARTAAVRWLIDDYHHRIAGALSGDERREVRHFNA